MGLKSRARILIHGAILCPEFGWNLLARIQQIVFGHFREVSSSVEILIPSHSNHASKEYTFMFVAHLEHKIGTLPATMDGTDKDLGWEAG